MQEFPIMSMRPGDPVTITEEGATHRGTVKWFHSYEGWRVCVELEDGSERVFLDGPNRWAKYWRD